MGRINVKLNEVSGFQIYPEGPYVVEIQESTKTKKSSTGNPKIGWVGKIIQCDNPEYVDKKIYWETSLLDQALFNLKALLEAMGMPWDEEGFELEDTYGKTVGLNVNVEPYEEEDRNKVKSYFKA